MDDYVDFDPYWDAIGPPDGSGDYDYIESPEPSHFFPVKVNMATTTRQTVRRGAPPPKGASSPRPTNGAVTSPTRAGRPQAVDQSGQGSRRAGNIDIPPFVIFEYGISGVGKTSKYAHLPNVGFIHDTQEQGINTLVRYKQVPKPKWIHQAEDWPSLLDILADVANKKFGIDFLVLDSATGFQKYCFLDCCARNFDNDFSKDGFFAYQNGPNIAATNDWPDLLQALQEVFNSGIGVAFLAHAEVKPFKNPDGPDYDQYQPVLQKDIWAVTHRWAEAVLFYNIHVEVGKEKGSTRNKAKSERRIICTEPAGAYKAKNWWGIPAVIDAGSSSKESYNALFGAIKKAASRGGPAE